MTWYDEHAMTIFPLSKVSILFFSVDPLVYIITNYLTERICSIPDNKGRKSRVLRLWKLVAKATRRRGIPSYVDAWKYRDTDGPDPCEEHEIARRLNDYHHHTFIANKETGIPVPLSAAPSEQQ